MRADLRRLFVVFVVYLGSLETTSCTVKPTRRLDQGGGDALLSGNIAIERSSDGSSANLKFETKASYSCTFSWYVQTTTPPALDILTWKPCVSPQPGRSFNETATGLKADALYTFAFKFWGPNSSEKRATVRTVDETAAPGDPSVGYSLRLDIPAKTLLADAAKLTQATDETAKTHLTAFACREATTQDNRGLLGQALESNPILKLISRGFLTGLSEVNPDLPGRLTVSATASAPAATEWIISVQSKNTSGSLSLNRPALLKNAVASQEAQASFNSASLEDFDLPAMKITGQKNLDLEWSLDGTPDASLVIATVTAQNQPTSIICGFEAKAGTASIPMELLAKFTTGRGIVGLRLDTVQAIPTQRWLVRSSDWRSLPVTW